MWIKNTSGKKDSMLTFATIAFLIVSLNVILSTIGSVTIGDNTVTFQLMDSATMGIYLTATFTAYVSRRWTSAAYSDKKE